MKIGKHLVVYSSIVAALVGAAPGHDSPSAKTPRPVSDGPGTRASNVKTVVRISQREGNTTSMCSATLMRPREGAPPPHALVLITASHCLKGSEVDVSFEKGSRTLKAKCTGNPDFYSKNNAMYDQAMCVLPTGDEAAVMQELQGQAMACLPRTPLTPGSRVTVVGFGNNPTIRGQNQSDNIMRSANGFGNFNFENGANGYTQGDSGGFTGTIQGNDITLHAIVSGRGGLSSTGVDVLSKISTEVFAKFLKAHPEASVCGWKETGAPPPSPSMTATAAPLPAPSLAPTRAPQTTPSPAPAPTPAPPRKPDGSVRPLVVEKVLPDSLADTLGLRAGDEIRTVNGRRVQSLAELSAEVAKLLRDHGAIELQIGFLRQGRRANSGVALGDSTRGRGGLGVRIQKAEPRPDPDDDW